MRGYVNLLCDAAGLQHIVLLEALTYVERDTLGDLRSETRGGYGDSVGARSEIGRGVGAGFIGRDDAMGSGRDAEDVELRFGHARSGGVGDVAVEGCAGDLCASGSNRSEHQGYCGCEYGNVFHVGSCFPTLWGSVSM